MLAYNNADDIVGCLSTLESQTCKSFNVIVVCDTSSQDATEAVIDDYASTGRLLHVLKVSGVGRSEARNIGWRATDAPIVMFADGDDVFEPWYLAKAIAELDTRSVGGVCLGGSALVSSNTLLNRYYASFGPTDARTTPTLEPDWAWVYRRELVEKVGGFDENLSQAEDKDLCARVKALGMGIAYVSGINWYHRKPKSFVHLLAKEYRAGKRRVFYELKTNNRRAFMRGIGPILFLGLTIFLAFFSALVFFSAFIAGIAVYSSVWWYSRRATVSTQYVLLFALISLAARVVGGLGILNGIVLLVGRRAGLRVDLGRL